MSLLYYLLEVNLYIIISYALYKMLYQKETFYKHNRFYLLISTALAFIIPIIKIGWLDSYKGNLTNESIIMPINDSSISSAVYLLFTVYILIAIYLVGILLWKVYKLNLLSKKTSFIQENGVKVVFISDEKIAYSFFNTLYIHPDLYQEQSVLQHESVHIQQKHSFDVIYLEILQILCWFNPFIYFLKNDLKLIHEYLADANCTKNDSLKHSYAMFLIENSFLVQKSSLNNHLFNQSLLKNRIIMLSKKRTTGLSKFRILLSLPLIALMLLISTRAFSKSYAFINVFPNTSTYQDVPPPPKPPLKAANKQDVPPPPKPPLKAANKQDVPPPPVSPKKKASRDQVKFPPPVIKPDKPKGDQVKFPPPVIKPDKPKGDQVKFPPPIVKPDKPKALATSNKDVPPPPVAPKRNN